MAKPEQRCLARPARCAGLALMAGLIGGVCTLPAKAFDVLEHETNLKSVYVHEMPDSNEVVTHLLIGAGEVDAKGPEGLAHYLEHLVMTNYRIKTGRKPTPHTANASTSSTLTNYVAGGLPSGLPELIRQMSHVLNVPTLSLPEMLRERNVVSREYDLRVLQNPGRQASQSLGKILYPQHPLRRSVSGTPASIAALRPSDAKAFHRAHYSANNATLIVVGKVRRSDVRRLVNREFARHPSTRVPARSWRRRNEWQPEQFTMERLDRNAKRPGLMTRSLIAIDGWDRRKLLVALPMLTSILNSALPGGLEGPLVHEAFLFSHLRLQTRLIEDGTAEFRFMGFTADNVHPRQAAQGLLATVSKIARNGVPQNSINRVRRRISKHAERQKSRVSSQARRSVYWAMHNLAPLTLAQEQTIREAVTKPDLDRLVHALANSARSATALIIPTSKE